MSDRAARGDRVVVVGGGLAGCEAAWQLAAAGIPVLLFEMRPERTTPAHTTGSLAELVCSNSLRSDNPTNAVGLLKREMEAMGSLVLAAARATALPAGDALAVDRTGFAGSVGRAIAACPLIEVVRREVTELPASPAILATGPLTSGALHARLAELLGEGGLSFYDAIAPVVVGDSLDHDRLFYASRYGKGGQADYLNAPLTKDEYVSFVTALLEAEKVPVKEFERDIPYFEGCLPIEVMAERGLDTLRHGPMKPVGLDDPRTGRWPYAVVQLRRDDLAATHWNLVGFQTRMTIPAQQDVLRRIPGLEQARFARYGMVHRNTFVCAPRHLDPSLELKQRPGLYLAGQLSGVEGYVESAAIGLLAGLHLAAARHGERVSQIAPFTAHGGLVRHLTRREPVGFQPANVSWGLIEQAPFELPRDKGLRRKLAAEAALAEVTRWRATLPWPVPRAGATLVGS